MTTSLPSDNKPDLAYRYTWTFLLATLACAWTINWTYQPSAEAIGFGPWLIAGILVMLGKTLPLWLFLFLLPGRKMKTINYLTFVALFYILVGAWNLFDPYWFLGLFELLSAVGLFLATLLYARWTKRLAAQAQSS